jgi:phage/plasmid-associated DNA primase
MNREKVKTYLQRHQFTYTVVCVAVYLDEYKTYKKDVISLNDISSISSVPLTWGCTAKNNDEEWINNHIILGWYENNKDVWENAVQKYFNDILLYHSTKKYLNIAVVYAIQTTAKKPTVDIDCKTVLETKWCKEMMSNNPYVLSHTKGLPKFPFFKESDKHMSPYNQKLGTNEEVEIQGEDNWAFISTDAEVYNAHLPLRSFNPDPLFQIYPPKSKSTKTKNICATTTTTIPTQNLNQGDKIDREVVEKVLDIIATDTTFNTQQKWVQIAYILLHHFEIAEAFELFRDFSMTVDAHTNANKFSMDKWRQGGDDYEFFHKLIPNGTKTFRSLVFYAMNIDEDRTKQIFPSLTFERVLQDHSKEENEKNHDKMMILGKRMVNEFGHATVADLYALSQYAKNHKYDELKKVWYSVMYNNVWYSHSKSNDMNWEIREVAKPYLKNATDTLWKEYQDLKEEDLGDDKKKLNTREKKLKQVLKAIDKLELKIQQLANYTFLTSVSNLLCSKLKENGFGMKLDTNPYVLAFENGLVDLKTESLETAFRAIEPEDYISLTTTYAFPSQENEQVKDEIVNAVNGLFLSQETREYMWDVFSKNCVGYDNDKSIYIHSGEGDNGKSSIQTLLKGAFGNLAYTLKTSTLCQKDATSNEHNDLPNTRGKKLIIASESSRQVKINSALIKRITGGDKMKERVIYEGDVEWTNMAKVHIFCNDVSAFSQMDKATANRLRNACYKMTFKSSLTQEEENNPFYGLMNPQIIQLCETLEWHRQFMRMLLQRYFSRVRELFDAKTIPYPEEIGANNKKYMKDNDEVYDFISTFYRKMTEAEIEVFSNKRKKDKLYRRPILLQTLFAHYKSTKPTENLNSNLFSRKLTLGGYEKRENNGLSTFCVCRLDEDENDDDDEYQVIEKSTPTYDNKTGVPL